MNYKISSFFNSVLGRGSREYVCIDAGARYIKGIYVSKGSINRFTVYKRKGPAVKHLSGWMRGEGLSAKKVKIAVKGNNTILRYTPFPKVDKKNLKEVFEYEMSKYIPFKAEDVYFDIAVLDDNYSADEFFILVAAAKRAFIDSLIGEFKQEKINIDTITLNNVALINLYLNLKDAEENAATLDIGASSALLNLFRRGIPSLSREIKISAEDFVSGIAKVKGISKDDAERIIAGLKEETDMSSEREIMKIAEETGVEIAEEIKNSLDYFEVNYGERLSKILLTGGLSKVKGFSKVIENYLGIKIELWDPFASASYNYNGADKGLDNYKEFLAVALGLSL